MIPGSRLESWDHCRKQGEEDGLHLGHVVLRALVNIKWRYPETRTGANNGELIDVRATT